MSSWDWLHAGLEVATYAQARQAQQNLKSMKTATEIEAGQKALVEAMRNFIFDIARDIQLAEDNIKDHPQQVYMIAKSLEWRLKDSGLTPEVFPEFSDKDYVLKTQKMIGSVISQSSSRLKPAQIEQSDTATKYIIEMPTLQEAIKAKSASEQIQATKTKWEKLDKENGSIKTKRLFAFLGIVGGPCLGFLIVSSSTNSSVGIVIGGLVLIGALAMLFTNSNDNPKYEALKTKREDWHKNLLPPKVWQQVINRFGGDLSSVEFQKMLDEREAYLKPILGDENHIFLNDNDG